jgi:hypothetical protein
MVEAHQQVGAQQHGQANAGQHASQCARQVAPDVRVQRVQVIARADDPAPGLKALHVGHLVHRLLLAGFGPLVGHKALAMLAHDVHHGLEQRQPVRVLDATDVGAVHRWFHGVHQHARLHVVDPEVFVAAMAQPRHRAQGRLLGLLTCQCARHFVRQRQGHQHRLGREVHAPQRAHTGASEAQLFATEPNRPVACECRPASRCLRCCFHRASGR